MRKNGGQRAVQFSAAYTQLSPGIAGYLETRGIEDPEAVTQDVFTDLYAHLDASDGTLETLKTLAYSLAHSRAEDHHRRKLQAPSTMEYDPDGDTRISAAAEDQVVAVDGAAHLLEGLVAEQREVMTLRVVGDLSIEQTAQIMNKTPGAVKQLQRRALAALRTIALKEEQYAC